MRYALVLALVTGLALWSGASAAHAAPATTTTINSCDAATLNNAITSAGSGDTITFGCSGTITLTRTLTISKNLTLDGSGQSVTLDGGAGGAIDQWRGVVLSVNSGVHFTLNALTITDGAKLDSDYRPGGGGLYNDGGTVTITNSTFVRNSSNSSGGGLYNDGSGTVTITNSTFVRNSSITSGGGLYNVGGTVTVSNSAFTDNSASLDNGGGLDNESGTVTVSNSTFTGNTANLSDSSIAEGGGLFNSGTVSITSSTFTANSAPLGGGLDNLGTMTISNSTFAKNQAGLGGGLDNDYAGTMTITNSTFADNAASGTAFVSKGGGGLSNFRTLKIAGSIVADSSGDDCHLPTALTDLGYNLSSDSTCGLTGTGSLQNTSPLLDPNGLQDHGGPTQTIAVQQGSPAIDKIPVASCPKTDQRGNARPDADSPAESACDIGAYETNYPPDSDLVLSALPPNIITNATSPSGATVTYTPPIAVDAGVSDPAVTVSCTPSSGSTFPIGTTIVTCTASDPDDSNSPAKYGFTVTVNDTDMTMTNVPANMSVDATSPAGAVVTYTPPTLLDEESPLPTVTCDYPSGSTFPIGTTPVTCSASDGESPADSYKVQFGVTVKDVTAPTLSLPGSVTAAATSSSGASVTYTASASDPDNVPSDLKVACSPASGSTFAVGSTTVKCTATDPYDNASTGSFAVNVQPATTALTLGVPATVTSGGSATLTAGVVGSNDGGAVADGGSVSFFDNGKLLNSTPAAVANGQASFSYTPSGIGSHAITASYSGDTGFQASTTSAASALTVIPTTGLSGADLSGVNLAGASLSGQNLSGSNLSGANLSGASLAGADLSSSNGNGANLSGANLQGANLSGANLNHANLRGANLQQANLRGTNLNGADLTNANLTGANLSGANLSGANLSQVTWSNTICPNGTNSGTGSGAHC